MASYPLWVGPRKPLHMAGWTGYTLIGYAPVRAGKQSEESPMVMSIQSMSDAKLRKEMGRRLRDARQAKGWSQSQLAAFTGWKSGGTKGVSPGAIGNYEQGTRPIPPHRAEIFGSVLGLPSAYFLCQITHEEAQVIAALRAARSTM